MKYYWSTDLENSKPESIVVNTGEMVYTPPKAPHKMVFLEDSVFVAISNLSRVQESYEADTKKLSDNFFPNDQNS
jgi:quercetin dioxygenase-like cupin family protein